MNTADTKKIEDDIKALERTLNALKSKLDAVVQDQPTVEKGSGTAMAANSPVVVQDNPPIKSTDASPVVNKSQTKTLPTSPSQPVAPKSEPKQTVLKPNAETFTKVTEKPVEREKPDPVSSRPTAIAQGGEQIVTTKDIVKNEDDEAKGPPIGEVGVFDGEFVWMPNEKKYQVPPNYISKTMLVAGDKLKMLSHGDQNEFKIMEQVERIELQGILTKKNYLWTAVVGTQEFKTISAAIRYHGGDIGDKVNILVPANYASDHIEWAAVVSVEKSNMGQGGYAGSKSAEEIQREKRMKFVPKRETPGPIGNGNGNERVKDNMVKPPITPPTIPQNSPKKPEVVTPKPVSVPPVGLNPAQASGQVVGSDAKSGEIAIRNTVGEVVLESTPKTDNVGQTPSSTETVITAMELSDIIPLR